MGKKNYKVKRTFIPQAIGEAVKKVNRNFSSRFNRLEFIIQSKWSEIAGTYFYKYSEPRNITKLPDYENEIGEMIYKNYLNVSVAPAAALEFQHFKDKIIEKINSYFGYKAIMDLRIQQNYIPIDKANISSNMRHRKLTENDKKQISNEVKELDNENLKNSLIDLGKNITKDS
tara:strand:- start:610 stop:1128 length:519 start_codon:yes stop_codon:yes gene_type:complete